MSDLSIDALLKSRKQDKISPDNAIAEFRQMLNPADGTDNPALLIRETAKQMGDITRELISKDADGPGKANIDGQVLENITVLRHEMNEYDEPDAYNKFIEVLKKDLLNGSLCNKHRARELWFEIKGRKLGLIDNGFSPMSKVTEEQAHEFLKTTGIGLPTRSR